MPRSFSARPTPRRSARRRQPCRSSSPARRPSRRSRRRRLRGPLPAAGRRCARAHAPLAATSSVPPRAPRAPRPARRTRRTACWPAPNPARSTKHKVYSSLHIIVLVEREYAWYVWVSIGVGALIGCAVSGKMMQSVGLTSGFKAGYQKAKDDASAPYDCASGRAPAAADGDWSAERRYGGGGECALACRFPLRRHPPASRRGAAGGNHRS